MAKFNFNEITLQDRADITKVDENFDKVETLAVSEAEKGVAGGIATLGADGKVPTTQLPTLGVTAHNQLTGLDYAGSGHTGFAPLASPALTGTPTAPTANTGTNTTQIATTAFVTNAVSSGGVTLSNNLTTTTAGTALDAYQGYVLNSSKAPTSHASTATTYGMGNASNYGHVKLSDSVANAGAASTGVGASSYAAYLAYNLAASKGSGDMLKSVYDTDGNGIVDRAEKGGRDSLLNNVGPNNEAWGTGALYSNTSGSSNVAVGNYALQSNTTGSYNTAVGHRPLYVTTTASYNTAVGYNALYPNIANYNTAIGYQALYSNTTAANNIAVGYQAGKYLSDGSTNNQTTSNSAYLGCDTKAGTAIGLTNMTVIGYNAAGSASNQITLGNTSITSLRCNVTSISSLSDARIKEDIEAANLQMCLDAVLDLPVTRYKFKDFVGIKLDKHVTGWLADDVEKIFPKAIQCSDEWFPELDENGNEIYETVTEQVPDGFDEDGNEKFREETREVRKMFKLEEVKNITMTEALPTLWGAVQQLAKEIEALKEAT